MRRLLAKSAFYVFWYPALGSLWATRAMIRLMRPPRVWYWPLCLILWVPLRIISTMLFWTIQELGQWW
jgi:hypothetical protein